MVLSRAVTTPNTGKRRRGGRLDLMRGLRPSGFSSTGLDGLFEPIEIFAQTAT